MGASQDRRVYRAIQQFSPPEVEDAIVRNDPDELRYVAISASMFSSDFHWAQEICLRLANHVDATTRGNAVLGFGHLARRFRRLDLKAVGPVFRDALNDPEEYVRSQAISMLDDIRYYLSLGSEWPGAASAARGE
jgi:hypothetical protein